MNLPDDLEQRLRDGIVEAIARLTEKVPGGNKTSKVIRQLSTQAAFYNAFDSAIVRARSHFVTEYTPRDEDLVEAIVYDGKFWESQDVRQALITMIQRPGSWTTNEREAVISHFADVLPKRINRERVDKAVTFFLQYIVEELWTLPGVNEIREIYNLQFQKMSAEATRQQVALLEAQLQATTQLSTDVREGLLQLASTLEKRLLTTPQPQPILPSPRPYHNLFQPDYTRFIGRQKELDWLRRHLSPIDRAWQMVIAGIGGVGKSSLALAIAHEYRERYHELPPEERFDAIIWITAKEEILTIKGRKPSSPPGLISRTLEDMYTAIAQTLEREDITRAVPGDQDQLVQKALSTQRTLLIVDNMETVTDERVQSFLYNLPVSTKCIITSREWIDVAAVLKLIGLPFEEAEYLINEEATARDVKLNEPQRQQLYRRTAGLPLPIKLSLARMASGETFEQVIRWLGDATGDLPEYCVKGQIDIARQRDPNAWKLLLACSLFDQDSGVTREALSYVADLSLADRDEGLAVLQRLTLLIRDDDDRFWVLPMVQGYAGAELVSIDFSEILTERWLAWLLKYTQSFGIPLAELEAERTQKIGLEYPNLLSAIRWCREHERWEMLLELIEGTWFYPYLSGLFSELQEILEATVQATNILQNERRKGRFMRQFGRLYWVQGQYEKALEYLKNAEDIALKFGDNLELGRVYNIRSDILSVQGHLHEAEQTAKTMLKVGKSLTNLELKILAVYRLSEFEIGRLHSDKALKWLDKGDRWSKELGWSRGLAWNLYKRGIILAQQGNIAAAEPLLTRSLSMATSWNERRLVAFNKHRLAFVYLDMGRFELAYQTAEEARDLYERLGGMTMRLTEVEELLGRFPKMGPANIQPEAISVDIPISSDETI
jgi:tetratricopeptide (TPR) repeat protein